MARSGMWLYGFSWHKCARVGCACYRLLHRHDPFISRTDAELFTFGASTYVIRGTLCHDGVVLVPYGEYCYLGLWGTSGCPRHAPLVMCSVYWPAAWVQYVAV